MQRDREWMERATCLERVVDNGQHEVEQEVQPHHEEHDKEQSAKSAATVCRHHDIGEIGSCQKDKKLQQSVAKRVKVGTVDLEGTEHHEPGLHNMLRFRHKSSGRVTGESFWRA